MSVLYHYTCDHGHEAITDTLRPNGWPLQVVWLTDLDLPMRDALGLTSHSLSCDRTAHRYRVTDANTAAPWSTYRRTIDPLVAHALESTPGVKPMHWWVSVAPVPVAYDPIGGAA